jgi:hypothetical protein
MNGRFDNTHPYHYRLKLAKAYLVALRLISVKGKEYNPDHFLHGKRAYLGTAIWPNAQSKKTTATKTKHRCATQRRQARRLLHHRLNNTVLESSFAGVQHHAMADDPTV